MSDPRLDCRNFGCAGPPDHRKVGALPPPHVLTDEKALEATRLRMLGAGMIFGCALTVAGQALFVLIRWLLNADL